MTFRPSTGGEDRHGRRDHRVAEEEGGADDSHGEDEAALLGKQRLDQHDERENAAFALVVGAHEEEDVFQSDDEDERPDQERSDARTARRKSPLPPRRDEALRAWRRAGSCRCRRRRRRSIRKPAAETFSTVLSLRLSGVPWIAPERRRSLIVPEAAVTRPSRRRGIQQEGPPESRAAAASAVSHQASAAWAAARACRPSNRRVHRRSPCRPSARPPAGSCRWANPSGS